MMVFLAQTIPAGTPWWVVILITVIVLPLAAWLGAFITNKFWPFYEKRADRQLSADEATAKAILELILETKNARIDISEAIHQSKSTGMAVVSLDSSIRAFLALRDPERHGRRAADHQTESEKGEKGE